MHRIFLSREQAETLVVFCKQRGLRDFRVANDDGVYVGQTYREEKCIYFFPRCNPAENPHWRDIVRDWLWNIAICDLLEIRMLEEVLSEDATYASISIRIELLGTVVEGFSTLPNRVGGIPRYRPRYTNVNRRRLS